MPPSMPPPPPEHPYAAFLSRVRKPSRYVGGEHGEIKKDWAAAQGRMCLAFPDVYDIGMSHLGFKILYGVVNGHEKLLAERAYAPWVDMEAELRRHGETLRSLESWRPLSDFDVVGFSLQFELTFTNILTMLELGGIPLRSAARSEADPLVLAGGPTATHAEPMAPFLDAVVIGDGEEKAVDILLTWTALRRAGMPRRARLLALARLGGVYVPSLYPTRVEPQTGHLVVDAPTESDAPYPVERTMVDDLNTYPFPSGGPVASTETIFDRVSVEIARGCTEGCRFCQAGMIYRPVRERDPQSILESVTRAVREGGYDEASLTSLSTADYSAIHPLVKEVVRRLEKERVSVSVSSLRAYGLDEELLDELNKVRATGLTFAPEAGTQRMRDVVNKNVTEAQLMQTAERVFGRGWSKMKLYFMLGLPTEEEADVRGIVQTGARAAEVGRAAQRKAGLKRGAQVTVSVSIHVPKPHTPFQWCAMDTRQQVREKQSWLREEARASRVKLRMHQSETSWLEGVLARGDRRLADVVEEAYRRGARFDSWDEAFRRDAWSEAFAACGVDPEAFLQTLPVTARLPWDHIDVGLEEGFLLREYRKALKNRLSPPCGKMVGQFVHATHVAQADAETKRLVCYDCGVACDLTTMRQKRRDFLVALGATGRGRAAAAVDEALPPPKPGLARVTPGVVPAGAPPPERPRRLRLRYAKLGAAAYRGHLDLVRLLPRVFRRASLPLHYSQGFHPKAEMTFSPALALGVAALGEYVDLRLAPRGRVELEGLVDRLNAVSELGLRFISAHWLLEGDRRISRVIDEGVYVAAVPRAVLRERGVSDERLRRHIEARRGGPMVVIRPAKQGRPGAGAPGIGKKIDVADYLVDVEPGAGAEVLEAAGLCGAYWSMRVRTRIEGSGGARLLELAQALLGEHARLGEHALPDEEAALGQEGWALRWVREALLAHVGGARVFPHDLCRLRAGSGSAAREQAAAREQVAAKKGQGAAAGPSVRQEAIA